MHRLWGSLAATQQLRTISTQVPQQPGLASMAETSKTKHITRCNYKPTITSQNLPWTRFLQHFPEAFSFGCRHNQLVVGHSKCNGSVHPCAAITIEILTIRQLPFFGLFWHLTLSIYPQVGHKVASCPMPLIVSMQLYHSHSIAKLAAQLPSIPLTIQKSYKLKLLESFVLMHFLLNLAQAYASRES